MLKSLCAAVTVALSAQVLADNYPTRLPETVTPTHYQLELTIKPETTRFSGHAEIAIALKQNANDILLHGKDLAISRVVARNKKGQEVTGQWQEVSPTGLAQLHFEQSLNAGQWMLVFDYDAPFNEALSGLYRVKTGDTYHAYTQFESIDARRAFPSFDEPRFKVPFDVSIIADATRSIIANTLPRNESVLENGMKKTQFNTTKPLPTYLVAFAVGDFDVVNGPVIPASSLRKEPIPLRGVAVKGQGDKLKFALDNTPALVLGLETYFGIAYPYGKLDLLAVPDFSAGAMENAGAITFRDTALLADEKTSLGTKRNIISINAHELAHQWFGNLVTMQWWNDIWLNEAFATWMGEKISREQFPEYDFSLGIVSGARGAMEQDALASQRPIRQAIDNDEQIQLAFDGITYQKGGGVLNMFESYIGAEKFRTGVRQHIKNHAFKNATAEDFIAAQVAASGDPKIADSFNSFLTQAGVPLLKINSECQSKTLHVNVEQSRFFPLGITAEQNALWHIPVCMHDDKGSQSCHMMTKKQETWRTPFACDATLTSNAKGAGYYRVAMDEAHWRSAVNDMAKATPAEALSIASDFFAAFDAGKIDANLVLELLPHFASHSERRVMSWANGSVGFIHHQIATENELPALESYLAKLYRQQLDAIDLAPLTQANSAQVFRRQTIYGLLAYTAKLPELRRALQTAGRAWLADPKSVNLAPELIGMALGVTTQDSGESVLNDLLQRLPSEKSGQLRNYYLNGILAVRDPALLPRIHALYSNPNLRVNEKMALYFAPLGQKETRHAQFDYVSQNWDTIIAALPPGSATGLAQVFGFCDATMTPKVEAFLSQHRIAGDDMSIALMRESVNSCLALKAAQSPLKIPTL